MAMNHMFFGLEVMSRNIRRQFESEQRWMCTLTLRVLVLQDELVFAAQNMRRREWCSGCDASNPTLSICTICMGTPFTCPLCLAILKRPLRR